MPSPLIPSAWTRLLSGHPDPALCASAVHDISCGVEIGYDGPRGAATARTPPNLPSAADQPEAITADLAAEVEAGRIIGPFAAPPHHGFVCSPLGSVPKKDTTERRRIHHLSFPPGNSVNSHIHIHDVCYSSIDDTVRMVKMLGRGALLCKLDVKAAFRCVGIRPTDRALLGMHWQGRFFADAALPFGMRSSPEIWDRYASLARWILVHRMGLRAVMFYVDDFLIGGAPHSRECELAKRTALETFATLGIPLSANKLAVDGTPRTAIKFVGILIDTDAMQLRLDPERLREIRTLIGEWLARTHCTVKELQKLIGKLSYASKMVHAARSFTRRLIDALRSATRAGQDTLRITPAFTADLQWWHRFAAAWNGVGMFYDEEWVSAASLHMHTDASGLGYGAVFDRDWMCERWSSDHLHIAARTGALSVSWLEMYALLSACTTFAGRLKQKRIIFHCDNAAVVDILHAGVCRDADIMDLVRALLFVASTHNFAFRVAHVPGVDNTAADLLSRMQVSRFRTLHPNCNPTPTTPLPPPIHRW